MQKTTINHKEIQQWAEKHKGVPEIIDHRQAQADTPGIRIDFQGKEDDIFLSSGNRITRKIPWDEFFKIFDDEDLAFMYDDKEFQEDPSLSYRFIKRNEVA